MNAIDANKLKQIRSEAPRKRVQTTANGEIDIRDTVNPFRASRLGGGFDSLYISKWDVLCWGMLIR